MSIKTAPSTPAPNPVSDPLPFWDLLPHVASSVCEALLAERLHAADPETIWHSPHTALKDVSAAVAGSPSTVDAKVAWIQNDQTGCEFICFMGAGRIPEARDGVDYYGLVVLSDSSEVRLVTSAGRAGLNAEGHIDGDIYLVLAATINASARPAPRSDGSPGAGRNLWLPMAEVRRNGIAL